jgi:hypothetical protein
VAGPDSSSSSSSSSGGSCRWRMSCLCGGSLLSIDLSGATWDGIG